MNCSNCNAPLPAAAPGTVVECRFCHTEVRVPLPTAPQVIVVGAHPRPNGVPSLVGLAVAGVIVAILGMSAVFVLAFRPAVKGRPGMISTPTLPAIPEIPDFPRAQKGAKGGVKPSEIPALVEKEIGWTEVDPTGMVGTFAAFDPNANAPWAVSIAKNWSNDAELESVYLTGVRPDGKMDLSARSDQDADYRFISKNLEAAQEKMKEVSEKKLVLEFRLMVQASTVKFLGSKPLIHRKPEVAASPPTFGCPIPKVIEVARASGLAPRPFYDGMARYDAYHKAWGWWVSGKETSSSRRVAVDATCKAW